MAIFRAMAMANKGLRYKLMLAFSLMTIIPLLACVYIISTYLFPKLDNVTDISMVILVSVIVALLGLLLARKIVDPVIDMAIEAKIIASGDYDRKISTEGDDELGNLGHSINSMTQKIKSNLDELKNYGQKVREVNVEIHKKVLALSSLLQIGDIIAAGSVQIDGLLEIAVEKVCSIFENGYAVLYAPKDVNGDLTVKTSCNLTTEKLADIVLRPGGRSFLEKVLEERSILAVDKNTKMPEDMRNFMTLYNINNAVIVPVCSGRIILGLLIVGSKIEEIKYKTDDIDLVKVFSKQITIAIESDILSKKTKELAIKDDLTDLYNKNFIVTRMEEEIKRAIFYQRPCSFIIFAIDDFKKFRDAKGDLIAEEALRGIAKLLRDNTSPIGKTARIGWDEFAMLLPEKNKKEAVDIAEDVRKKVEVTNFLKDGSARLTVSVGVSENPLDGATGDELLKKAKDAAKQAGMTGKNKVVV